MRHCNEFREDIMEGHLVVKLILKLENLAPLLFQAYFRVQDLCRWANIRWAMIFCRNEDVNALLAVFSVNIRCPAAMKLRQLEYLFIHEYIFKLWLISWHHGSCLRSVGTTDTISVHHSHRNMQRFWIMYESGQEQHHEREGQIRILQSLVLLSGILNEDSLLW